MIGPQLPQTRKYQAATAARPTTSATATIAPIHHRRLRTAAAGARSGKLIGLLIASGMTLAYSLAM
jgi:hypothetical protein